MFLEMGRHLGFEVRPTFSRTMPTDGCWFVETSLGGLEELPVAALEVAVSESGKTLAGSVATLEAISPALGILLVQTDEITRGLVRSGMASDAAAATVAARLDRARGLAARSRQRLAVWDFEELVRRYALATGKPSLYALGAMPRAP